MKNKIFIAFVICHLQIFSQNKPGLSEIFVPKESGPPKEKSGQCEIFIPSEIGPHNEKYDKWMIQCNCGILKFNLELYNRWGEKIYSQNQLKDDHIINWDFYKAEQGTYVWKLKMKLKTPTGERDTSLFGQVTRGIN